VDKDPDNALVARCKEGDRAALETLVRRYQRPLYNAAYRVLGNAEDASDTTQVVFMRMWERLGEFDPQHKFFSWIYRITVNESLNLLRRNGREEPLGEDEEIPDSQRADPAWQYHEAQLSRRIQQAMMQMKADDRVVLTLRHFSELGYREIAQVLALEEKTVKSRLFEARRRLRELLGDI
jgi:RNA polymerase sigma-70 factor (ECF subfamily)